ncbi:MAG: DEAD/DEAH box helicase [Verrucomicrobiales bacterium]|nr:DEAD/DEAH box helicase [Verrucomicrobiales bacterium]
MAIELTDKILMDAGGWKEMKEARQLHKAGKVRDASYENGMLSGTVSYSGKELQVRMEIRSRTDMENLCPCFRAKRDGIICCHSLALGLEVLNPTANAAPAASAQAAASAEKAPIPLSKDWPKIVDSGDKDSIPAEFHLIFSPDLPAAWQKNSLLLGIEVVADGERKMLAALKGKYLFIDARDHALFRYLQTLSPDRVPSSLTLPGEDFLKLVGNLAGHPRVMLGKKEPVEISYLPLRPGLELHGEKIKAVWPAETSPLIAVDRAWALRKGTLHPVASGLPKEMFDVFGSGHRLNPAWMSRHSDRLEDWFEIDDSILSALPEVQTPQIAVQLEGSLNHQEAALFFIYGDVTAPASIRESQFVNGGITDTIAEREAIDVLENYGYSAKGIGTWVLKDKTAILRFLAHGFPRLSSKWLVSTGERFDHALTQIEPVQASFDFQGSGENWFAMDLSFSTPGGETISRAEIQRILQMGQESQKLSSGKIAVLDTDFIESLQETVSDVDPRQDTSGTYTIDRTQAGYLLETAESAGVTVKGASPWVPDFEFEDIDPSLSGILRPYQKDGTNWMLQLAGRGMGGILADDMGLGKTLQTLTAIHTIGGSALVVCPSSLVSNWVAEANKFVPDLKTVALEGPNRDKVYHENEDANLFVTSYALLRIDEKKWRERGEFTIVVLDEAQNIKNPEAKVTKAAHRLQGTYRYALTGTPVENSVRDLWSISQFALPGYLGSKATFAERFEKPISKGDQGAQMRLSRRLKPVILRRLKKDVAKDLPDKIEQVIYCDLKPKQQAVYEQILRESREAVLDAEGGRKRMMALTALLRLRQTCCDLRLLGLKDVTEAEASVKLDALQDLLLQAVEGQHKVLIFSQFVEMLQVLVPVLAGQGLKFCYLDGSTKNRGEVVKQFQENDDIPVFLISLKAGGVGLNLTAADTVIHVDPWWNPAVEAQATDRAHRIGQTRVVTSYKLITRNTVEEKILALQNKKKETIKSIIDGHADLGDTGLSEEEIMDLLEG